MHKITNEINAIHEEILESKKSIATEISKHFEFYNKEINSFDGQVKNADFRVSDLKSQFGNLQSIQNDNDRQLRRILSELDVCKINTSKLKTETLKIEVYKKDNSKITQDLLQLRYGLSDLNINLQTTDNYLDKYIPFRIQNLISETLDNVIDSHQHKKLTKYEKYKFKKMHDYVLNDEGIPDFDKGYGGVKVYQLDSKFHMITLR